VAKRLARAGVEVFSFAQLQYCHCDELSESGAPDGR
jgi:hypothetical protein